MSSKPDIEIQHHCDQHRFETIIEGLRCELDYQLSPSQIHITHTGVPRALEGRGIAAALVHEALTWARSQQLKVDPVCSYVATYLRRHPEWHDIT